MKYSSTSNSNISFKTFGSNSANNYIRFTANNVSTAVDYDLTWSIAGMNVDNQNISDINVFCWRVIFGSFDP